MQLAILLVVVCALCGAGSDAQIPGGIEGRLLAALALLSAVPLVPMLARALLRRGLASGRIDRRGAHRQWECWLEVIAWTWALSALVLLYIGHWPQVVRSTEFTRAWPLVDDLLILAPPIFSLLAVWIACHGVERLLQSGSDERLVGLRQYVELRVRHYLGLTLLPALVILGIQETAVSLNWTSGADDQRAWWLLGALLAAAVIGLPLVLRWLWKAQRVADSPLKQRLMASCRRLGCGVRDIVVWRTGGTLANAAVAGLLPGWRTIFLSDGLIERLNDDEIDVVVRHEAAHLARRHLWQRMAVLGAPVFIYFAIQAQWPQLLAAVQHLFTQVGIAPLWQMTLMVPLAAVAYALVMMGSLARMQEHDADLVACCTDDEMAISGGAVGHLHAALFKLVGDCKEYRKGGWLHPSVRKRIGFLREAREHPHLAARFRRRLLRLSCGLLMICAASLVGVVWLH